MRPRMIHRSTVLGSTPTWAATSVMVSRAPVMQLRSRSFATEPPGRRDRTFLAYRDVPTNPAEQFSRPAQRSSNGASQATPQGGNREAPDRHIRDRVPVRDGARAGGGLRVPPAQR